MTETPDKHWMDQMMANRMIDVWFRIDGDFYCEPQVNDPTTLEQVLTLRMAAYRSKSAFYAYQGRWLLYRPNHPDPLRRITYYDSREAVEMMVMHGK